MADSTSALLASIFGGSGGGGGLDSFTTALAENDIFSKLGGGIGGMKFDQSTWSPGTSLAVNAGQALLSGILGGYGQRQQAQQVDKVIPVLKDLYGSPMTVTAPEGVDEDAFAALRMSAMKNKLMEDVRQESEARQFKKGLFADMFTKRPDLAVKMMPDIATDLDVANIPLQRSTSPEYEAALSEAGGDETLARDIYKRRNPEFNTFSDAEKASAADSLRKELNTNKELADFGEVKNRVQVLQQAVKDPTSVADLDFVYSVAKVLDPASVVRESEGQMVIDSQSLPASLLGRLNKAAQGGSALDRKALYDLVERHYSSRRGTVEKILDRYTDIAGRRGLSTEDILPFTKESLEVAPISIEGPNKSIPPGMKLQRNKRTGETRLVPQ